MSGAVPPGWRHVRVRAPDGRVRTGVISPDDPTRVRLDGGGGRETIDALAAQTLALPPPWRLLAPVESAETWAAGVTYERSRDARIEESRVEDVYSLVYEADRPELFLKDAGARRTVGPGEPIGIRSDATWTVPEPELALVLERGRPVAVTIGNDVSSRDLEGANPL